MNHVASSSISMRTGKTFGALIERVEGEGFEPSPRRPDSRFSAAFVTLGRIKVDSILDHFWTPANTD